MKCHCRLCGRYLSNVLATVDIFGIIEVRGKCKKCGEVMTEDWIYEDFFPPKEMSK